MVNNSRSNRYTRMMIEAQTIIKKKNIEIQYRKYLQIIIDQTNDILSKRNVFLEDQNKQLENQIYLKSVLYEFVFNNNEILIDEINNHKKIIDSLTQENTIYKQLLQKKVKKTTGMQIKPKRALVGDASNAKISKKQTLNKTQ